MFARPGDVLVVTDLQQQLQLFREQRIVIFELEAKERERFDERAAARDDFGAPVRDQVERGEFLEDPDRVSSAEHGDRAGQPDALRSDTAARITTGAELRNSLCGGAHFDPETSKITWSTCSISSKRSRSRSAGLPTRLVSGGCREAVDADLHSPLGQHPQRADCSRVASSAKAECYVARLRMKDATITRPSALIPLAMSLAALGVLFGHIVIVGTARQADEGTAAHLWQLLMAGQLPVIAFFAISWLPRRPLQALVVLALQAAAGIAAAAPVFLLGF